MNYNFEWDIQKAKQNKRKHKVTFENASTIFRDPKTLSIYDSVHSEFEDRWITLGISSTGNLIVVSHTFNEIDKDNMLIRIISARKATKLESNQYEEGI